MAADWRWSPASRSPAAAPTTAAHDDGGGGDGGGGGGDATTVTSCPRTSATPTSTPATPVARRRSRSSAAPTPRSAPTTADPDAQVTFINTAAQQGIDALVISANDPKALCDSIDAGPRRRHQGRHLRLRHRPDCRDLFINQATAEGIAQVQVEMIAEQIGDSGEIAILSAAANATNQNAWIEHDGGRRSPPTTPTSSSSTPSTATTTTRSRSTRPRRCCRPPGPQGHHLADHGRHRRGRPLPVHLGRQGQGRADRSGHAEPDA